MEGVVYQIEIGPYKQIGSTGNLEQRIYHHKYHLEKGSHYNRYMQRVYDKYGVLNTHILFQYETREEAYKKEQKLLDKYYRQPYYLMEHPMAVGGSKPGKEHPLYGKKRPTHSKYMKDNPEKCGLNYKRTDEHIQKLRNRNRGWVQARDQGGNTIRVRKEEFDRRDDLVGHSANRSCPKRYKPIRCLEDDICFNSIQEAAKYYDLQSGNIVRSLKHGKSAGLRKLGRNLNFEYLVKDLTSLEIDD